jgi:hypothetical protein
MWSLYDPLGTGLIDINDYPFFIVSLKQPIGSYNYDEFRMDHIQNGSKYIFGGLNNKIMLPKSRKFDVLMEYDVPIYKNKSDKIHYKEIIVKIIKKRICLHWNI